MHSALLVIEKEAEMDATKEQAWNSAMASIRETLTLTDQVEELAENVWLIPLRSDLSTLSLLIATCMKYRGLAYRVLFLNEAPEWVLRPVKARPPRAGT